MNIEGNELISIYLFLLKNEEFLDNNQQSVKNKIEKEIFNNLSIEEMESIGELYAKKVDVLGKKL
jgi:predicted lactoylglutathione lyase